MDQKALHFPKAVAVTMITRLVMVASALGASIIVGRWLGPEGLGTLAVITVTIALGMQLGSFGLPSANTYFISRNRNDLGKLWSNSLVFAIPTGVAIALAIVFAARMQPATFGRVGPGLIAIAAIALPFNLILLLGLNVFLAVGQIKRLNITDAVAQLALLANAVVVLIVLRSGLVTLVVFNTALAVIFGFAIALMVHRIVRAIGTGSYGVDLATFGRMVRYGGKFHIAVVAAIVIVRADVLLVNYFRGATEAGVYAVAGQSASLLLMLPAVIATLLFPRVAADPDPQAKFTMRVTRHTAFLMALVCLAAVPFSLALPFIYGSEFEKSTIQLLILLPGVYLMALESVMVQHFTGSGLPIAVPLFWVVVVIFNLGLNVLLIPSYGATAAAVVSSFTYALIFLLVAIYFRAKTGNSLASALVMRREELRQLMKPGQLRIFSE